MKSKVIRYNNSDYRFVILGTDDQLNNKCYNGIPIKFCKPHKNKEQKKVASQ